MEFVIINGVVTAAFDTYIEALYYKLALVYNKTCLYSEATIRHCDGRGDGALWQAP